MGDRIIIGRAGVQKKVGYCSSSSGGTMDKCLEAIGTEEWKSLGRLSAYHPSDVAVRVGISIRRLERYFRQHFGETPRAWLGRLLVADASALLRQGNPVKMVAIDCGFSDICHFDRAFKRIA